MIYAAMERSVDQAFDQAFDRVGFTFLQVA